MYDAVFAEFYDKLFTDHKYELEIELFRPYFKGNRCLDLGCGTGRHLKFISGLFDEVYGLDPSLQMLNISDKRIKQLNLKNVILANSFTQIEKNVKFNTIVSLFNVVNHILTHEELVEFFRNTFNFLHKKGVFLFDCWNSAALIHFEDRFTRKHLLSDQHHCTEESHIDFESFLNTIDYTIETKISGNVTNTSTFKLVQRIWSTEELNAALNEAKLYKYTLHNRENMKPTEFGDSSVRRLAYLIQI